MKRQITVPRKKGWNGNLENFEDLTRAFRRRSVWRRASVFENDVLLREERSTTRLKIDAKLDEVQLKLERIPLFASRNCV